MMGTVSPALRRRVDIERNAALPQPSNKSLRAELERRELLVVTREAELNRTEAQLRRLKAELEDREGAVAARESTAPEPSLVVVDSGREDSVAARERELSENATVLAQREQSIAAREAELEGKEVAAEQRVRDREDAVAEREHEVDAMAAVLKRKSIMEREQFALVRAELDERTDQLRALWEELREERKTLDARERKLKRAAAEVGVRELPPLAPRPAAPSAPAPRPAAAPAPPEPRVAITTAARLAEPDIAEATVPGSASREPEVDDEWWGKVLGRPVVAA